MRNTSPLFRGSILAELVSRTLFVGILILFVYGGFAYYVSKRTFDSEMGDRLLAIARLSAGQVKSEWLPFLNGKGELYGKFRDSLEQKKKESQAKNIFILDTDGRVLVDANGQYGFKENNWLESLDPQPFSRAKAGLSSASILLQENDGSFYKIGYSPIYQDKKVIAVMGVEASANFMEGLNEFARVLFSFGLVCLLVMGALLYAFGRRFISPIEEMAKASERIAEGDFSQRVRENSTNELGALAHAFNEMTKRLQSHNEYILESMSNGLLVVDLNGYITTFNRAASQVLDIPQGKILGQHFKNAFALYPGFLAAIERAHDQDRRLENLEVNLSEESPKFIRLRSAPLLGADAQELGTEILFTDETQLRKLQDRIKTSEKMATIGELAAGIAHEIRNPLGAMKGFAEILQRKLADQPKDREIVTDIASEIEILNKIVTNFLVFAKPTSVEAQEMELGAAIAGVLPLVQKEADQKQIEVRFEKKGDVFLRLDVEQFRRALLNLSLNAIQASSKNSDVVIGMQGFSRPELMTFLRSNGFTDIDPTETEGYWAAVWVRDHGPGILPENLKKLFTPFFTTKTEGFGLGLSITRKILEALDGQVSVANPKEGGAFFLMVLPAIERKDGAFPGAGRPVVPRDENYKEVVE